MASMPVSWARHFSPRPAPQSEAAGIWFAIYNLTFRRVNDRARSKQDVELLLTGDQRGNRPGIDHRRRRVHHAGSSVVLEFGRNGLLKPADGLPDLAIRTGRIGLAGSGHIQDHDGTARRGVGLRIDR